MCGKRLSWLLTPLHVAALATGAKSFRDNPVIGSASFNRAGLHITRVRLAHQMAEWRRKGLAALISEEDRAAFERDGFILKRDFLDPSAYQALKEQVLSYEGPVRAQLQGDALTRRIALDERVLSGLPQLRKLVEGPEWLGLVRYVGSFMLEPLVYMKLLSNRLKDKVHVQDLIGVGLIDRSWLAKLPPVLAERLQGILDTPDS